MEFEKNYIHHLVYQILPSSRKPKDINDISKSKKIMEKLKSNKPQLNDILKRESEDVIELIKKLADLHSAGILTDEEFSEKKSEFQQTMYTYMHRYYIHMFFQPSTKS